MDSSNDTSNTVGKTKASKRTTLGRRKIEIKKISNTNSRQVTFSKRRLGLFRKASELCILTGAEAAIIVHSLGDRVFSYGHPSVESVINRYINGAPGNPPSADLGALQRKQQYASVSREIEAEKKKQKTLTEAKEGVNYGNFWWNEPVDNLGIEELRQYMAALEELKKNVIMRADQFMLMKNSSASASASKNIKVNARMMAPSIDGNYINYGSDPCSSLPYKMPYGNGHI